MTVGNGTYESIPDSENGSSSRGGRNKWLIGSVALATIIGAVYGTTTYINKKADASNTDAIMKAVSGTSTKLDASTGKLKLFDDMSKFSHC
jgi:hypothetical protein